MYDHKVIIVNPNLESLKFNKLQNTEMVAKNPCLSQNVNSVTIHSDCQCFHGVDSKSDHEILVGKKEPIAPTKEGLCDQGLKDVPQTTSAASASLGETEKPGDIRPQVLHYVHMYMD